MSDEEYAEVLGTQYDLMRAERDRYRLAWVSARRRARAEVVEHGMTEQLDDEAVTA